MGDQFVWLPAGSGAWNTAGNWTDTTLGATATRPPTTGDIATITGPADNIEFDLLSGGGAATSFAVAGNVALGGGSFNFGTLADSGNLALLAGVAVTTSSLAVNGAVGVTDASLVVSGQLSGGYGSIIAADHATITVGSSAFTPSYGEISVDPTSVFEIGTAGGAAAGTITVDAGAILIANGSLVGPVLDQGTIESTGAYSLTIADAVGGTGELLLASSFLFVEGSVSASNTIAFTPGSSGTLAIGAILPASGILAFQPGQAIEFENLAVSSAAYDAGTLTLSNGASAVGSLKLSGSYASESFVVLNFAGYGESTLFVASGTIGAGGTPAGAGTSSSDSYAWIPIAGGVWGAAANWTDTTTGSVASVAPGTNDLVTITGSATAFQVISGQGNAASLAITGKVALGGLFHATQIAVGGGTAGTLAVIGGGVTAGAVTIAQGTLAVSGSVFTISGVLNNGSTSGGAVAVEAGGTVSAGNILENAYDSVIQVDSSSVLEIGTAGGAASGYLTVDAGTDAMLGGYIDAAVMDKGTIASIGDLTINGGVTGTGRLLLGANALGAQYASLMTLSGPVGAGITLDFVASGEVVDALGGFAGTIADFAPGDFLVDSADRFNAASYAASGSGTGILTLTENGTTIATIGVLGNYAADSFIVRVGSSGNLTTSTLVVASGTGGAGGTAAGPGTAGADSYNWIPTAGGSWNTASNWTDTTTGSTAVVAPGSLDLVTINGGAAEQVVSGQGNAASLSLLGTLALGGSFTAGTVGGTAPTLDIVAGTLTSTGNATLASTRLISVDGNGTALAVAGTLTVDGITAAGGGAVLASALYAGTYPATLQADSASEIEIGTTTGAQGVITVGNGATISGGFSFGSAVVDNGVITVGPNASDIAFDAAVTGSGTIVAGAGADLVFSNSVATSITIVLGAGAGLVIQADGQAESFASYGQAGGGILAGPIVGYAAGDEIEVNGGTFDTASYAGTANGGTLTLSSDGTAVGTLMLQGNYLADNFIVPPSSFTGSETIVMTLACFAAGTGLDTPLGTRQVEELRVGDLVLTRDGATTVRWIGSTHIDLTRHPEPAKVAPVRVLAEAFGHDLPRRDLLLSPDHAVALIEGGETVLVPIHLLVNGATIRQELDHPALTYFHVELDRHDILLAEGLPAESYLDTGNRGSLTPDAAIIPLHPRLVPDSREAVLRIWAERGCAPLLLDGKRLEALHAGLLEKAARRFGTPELAPQPILIAAGRHLVPDMATPDYLCFIVPSGARQVTLMSPVAALSWFDRGAQDHRLLGLAVSHIQHEGVPIALTALSGCHEAEAEWRWTRGSAMLDLPGDDRETVLEFRLQPTGLRHWPAPWTTALAA